MNRITRIYTQHYRDNGALRAYVDWADGSRTEGAAQYVAGKLVPCGVHMNALFDRAMREGLTIERVS